MLKACLEQSVPRRKAEQAIILVACRIRMYMFIIQTVHIMQVNKIRRTSSLT